ncbi:hypothetical protein Glove_627g8 [Diversispora epigaea]|uniref:Putative amidase domain-containing protein n=1 Tax=Diversispora epigaea TaxID=1348612 RepID=A0A397G5F8_9GLOM|nr:hypothetical protein Glove_627g8 [Diversispora epigaea]
MTFNSTFFIIILCLISAAVAYDGIKARDYAIAHCDKKNHNTAYPTFKDDSTNFASQILEAGGIPQSAEWYCHKPCNKNYWREMTLGSSCYKGYEFTKSWSTVNDLYNYLIKNEFARVCDLKDLKPGDLIQYNKKKFNKKKWAYDYWHHTSVVIEQSPTNPKLVDHSTDRCDADHAHAMKADNDFRPLCIGH